MVVSPRFTRACPLAAILLLSAAETTAALDAGDVRPLDMRRAVRGASLHRARGLASGFAANCRWSPNARPHAASERAPHAAQA